MLIQWGYQYTKTWACPDALGWSAFPLFVEWCSIRVASPLLTGETFCCSSSPVSSLSPDVCRPSQRTVGTTGSKQHGDMGVKLLINPILGVFPGLQTFQFNQENFWKQMNRMKQYKWPMNLACIPIKAWPISTNDSHPYPSSIMLKILSTWNWDAFSFSFWVLYNVSISPVNHNG